MTAVFTTLLAVTLGAHLVSILLVWRRYRPGPAPEPRHRPFASLVRPVCGLDRFDVETLASSFGQDYGAYEVIFCVAHPDDPTVAPLRAMIAAHPETEAQILFGDSALSANPKLNNLVKGYVAARSDWVVMTDANLLLPPDYLTRVMAEWTEDTGLVSGPPVGIRPGNFWGALECAFLNTNQARWQLAADALGIGFAQGKTLAWPRPVLEAGGGLPALGQEMAEDVASTKLVRAQGLRVRLTRQLFAQPIGKRDARAVWGRQLRWSKLRKHGFPRLFLAEILQGPLVPALALAALAPGWTVAALLAVWYGAEWALARHAGWPAGARDVAAMLLRDALLPALWAATFSRRGFSWRGTDMGQSPAAQPAE